MNWLIARLHESSTWRGIILLLTVCGMKLEPDQQEAIIAAGLAIVGLLGAFTRDKTNDEVVKPSIELQSRLGRGSPVPDDPVDVGPHDSRASTDRVGQPERVQTAMQSPLNVKKYRNVDPEPPIKPFGFNDR